MLAWQVVLGMCWLGGERDAVSRQVGWSGEKSKGLWVCSLKTERFVMLAWQVVLGMCWLGGQLWSFALHSFLEIGGRDHDSNPFQDSGNAWLNFHFFEFKNLPKSRLLTWGRAVFHLSTLGSTPRSDGTLTWLVPILQSFPKHFSDRSSANSFKSYRLAHFSYF